MSDFKDIWTEDEGAEQGLSEEQLMAYLEGRLPEAERHEVEALLSSEGMESDALEGLQSLGAGEAQAMKRHLNAGLQQALKSKKRRKRRGIADSRWTLLTIVLLLLLAIVCFGVMWLLKHPTT